MQISRESERWSIAANRRRQKLREPHRLNLRNSLLVATKDACELFAFYASGNARNVAFGHRPMLGNGLLSLLMHQCLFVATGDASELFASYATAKAINAAFERIVHANVLI